MSYFAGLLRHSGISVGGEAVAPPGTEGSSEGTSAREASDLAGFEIVEDTGPTKTQVGDKATPSEAKPAEPRSPERRPAARGEDIGETVTERPSRPAVSEPTGPFDLGDRKPREPRGVEPAAPFESRAGEGSDVVHEEAAPPTTVETGIDRPTAGLPQPASDRGPSDEPEPRPRRDPIEPAPAEAAVRDAPALEPPAADPGVPLFRSLEEVRRWVAEGLAETAEAPAPLIEEVSTVRSAVSAPRRDDDRADERKDPGSLGREPEFGPREAGPARLEGPTVSIGTIQLTIESAEPAAPPAEPRKRRRPGRLAESRRSRLSRHYVRA